MDLLRTPCVWRCAGISVSEFLCSGGRDDERTGAEEADDRMSMAVLARMSRESS